MEQASGVDHKIPTENIKLLTTILRVFLLKFLKVYRTTSTHVLGILAGIPPLYLLPTKNFKNFRSGFARPPSSVVFWMSVNLIILLNCPVSQLSSELLMINLKLQIVNSRCKRTDPRLNVRLQQV
ncbi:hypothetical protein AVEN_150300-1 [Araneus ventricosus]|uniref:Uncharacterized protein n=1 Tax=Araneus ventricosus TaxID=182803 RepID=A0A4Y2X0K1_ARAVE|nr:hypothetical protein AVEN_150300-1 [Araneus ventricosus]